jgi:hypothetical protein
MTPNTIQMYIGASLVVAWQPGLDAPVMAEGKTSVMVEKCLRAVHLSRRVFRPRVRVWLSSMYARPFMVGPVAGLAGWSEVQALATAAAPNGTGLSGDCAVRIEAWPGDTAVLATAIDRSLVGSLCEVVQSGGGRLASIRPSWASPLNLMLRSSVTSTVASFEDADGAIVVAVGRQGFEAAMTLHPPPSPSHLDGVAARLAFGHDIDHQLVRQRFTPKEFEGATLGWSPVGFRGTPA